MGTNSFSANLTGVLGLSNTSLYTIKFYNIMVLFVVYKCLLASCKFNTQIYTK
jgi:hypothetical protein